MSENSRLPRTVFKTTAGRYIDLTKITIVEAKPGVDTGYFNVWVIGDPGSFSIATQDYDAFVEAFLRSRYYRC